MKPVYISKKEWDFIYHAIDILQCELTDTWDESGYREIADSLFSKRAKSRDVYEEELKLSRLITESRRK